MNPSALARASLLASLLTTLLLTTFAASTDKAPPTYVKGTILGWTTRVDVYSSGQNGTNRRNIKVFELKGDTMIYQVDKCGAFQAGQFTPGQAIEYRLEGDKIYIKHDENKEYKCKMDGMRTPDGSKDDKGKADVTPAQQ